MTSPSVSRVDPAAGPYILHADAGGTPVYLLPDLADDNADQYVQTWNYDPTLGENPTWTRWMLWHIEGNNDGTYAIRSNPTRRFLTDVSPQMTMIKLAATENQDQRWNIIHVANAWAAHVYLITPATRPDYALTNLGNSAARDSYVTIRRMWAGPAPSFYWSIVPAPKDLRNLA